jgi:hypothetical protein
MVKQAELEHTKGVIRIRKSKKNRQHYGQKKKMKMTNNDLQYKHRKLKIPTKNREWTQLLQKGTPFCSTSSTHLLCYSNNKPGSAYDKWNISMIICDTYIP